MILHDLAGTESAMSDVARNVAAILAYVQAVQAITFEPRPLFMKNREVGVWDPMRDMPAVKGALQTAQRHCQEFRENATTFLARYPARLASAVNSASAPCITGDLAAVATVMAQMASGGVPTGAQRQTVNGALANLISQVGGLRNGLAGMQQGAATFQDQLAGDIRALGADAQTSLAAAAGKVRAESARLREELAFFGPELLHLVDEPAQQMLSTFDNIQDKIGAAITAARAVAPALTRLQSLFAGLLDDYANFAQEVQKASDAQFGSLLQQLDCSLLRQYWQNVSAYATAHGFGVPAI